MRALGLAAAFMLTSFMCLAIVLFGRMDPRAAQGWLAALRPVAPAAEVSAPAVVDPSAAVPRAAAAPVSVLDADAVPGLSAAGRASYREWLSTNLPRVFALSPSGQYAWWSGGASLDDLRARATKRCAEAGGTGCVVYAENLDVVWPGRRWQAPPVPGPLISGPGYAFVPDERFIWRGPGAAAGVFVWGHGYNGRFEDVRGGQPPSFVRLFNNAGFDIVRFDRAPATDLPNSAASWLRAGLAKLRARGYQFVIAGGQSRGAVTSMQILDTPDLADAVVAVAGGGTGPEALYVRSLVNMLNGLQPTRTRLAVVQFSDDPYSPEPDWRTELHRANGLVGNLLVIDKPDGFSGHFAGYTDEFRRQFGPCLLRFVQGREPGCPRGGW